MSRYIDADALKQKWLFRGKDGKPYRDEIDAMPTVDVVEILSQIELAIGTLPSAEPEPVKFHVDHDLTEEEIKNLKQKIADSPIVLIPSAERRGKWVVDDEYIDCSACQKEKWSRVPYEDLVKRFRYCPNCGAKMDERREDGEIH